MRVVSVNVSPVRSVNRGERVVQTAIFKQPVAGSVAVGLLSIAGDDQADKRHHGGPHQAVYALSVQEYDHWRAELARTIEFGLMGENLTIDGLDDGELCIGDVLGIGSVQLQVTKTRAPCATLAMAMQMPTFPKLFLARRRVGPYFRVIKEGQVSPGDDVRLVERDPARLSCMDATWLMLLAEHEPERWRRAAEIPALCPRWKEKFLSRAAGAENGG